MSPQTFKINQRLICLLCGFAFLVLALLPATFTQAQDKPVSLKDAVERLGPNQIRAKTGFRLIPIEGGWEVEQTGKVVRRLEKRIKCGACPGGNCRPRNGACVPRNSCTSSSCLIDPF
jgi:hypothetical protein